MYNEVKQQQLYKITKTMGLCFSKVPLKPSKNKDILLEDVRLEDTTPYSPPVTVGKVVDVYDGDTCTVAFQLNGQWYHTKLRLLGIDTPEIRGSPADVKVKAFAARDALSELVLGKVVELKNAKMEKKWGRLLADIYIGSLHVNKYMLDNGYGVPYDGGTKKK